MLSEQYAQLWNNKRFVVSTVWGFLVIVVGMSSGDVIKPYLEIIAKDVHQSPDLFLDRLPVVYTYGLATWTPPILCLIFLLHLIYHPRYFPFALKSVGILYLVRSCFLFLTPFGVPDSRIQMHVDTFLGKITYVGYDFFFSGHVAFPCMLMFLFWKHHTMRTVYLIITILMAAAVLLEHLHYSLDVFAAPFMAWGVLSLCNHFFRQDRKMID